MYYDLTQIFKSMNFYRLKLFFLTFIICFFVKMSLFAQNNVRITIKKQNITLKEALREIEKQSSYMVAFNETLLGKQKCANINIQSLSLEEAISQILKGTNLSFTIKDKYIMITSRSVSRSIEKRDLSGVVTDSKGEPIIGANIKVAGAASGTISDINGHFSLKVSKGDVLEFSYIGYTPKNQKVSEFTNLSIVLDEDTKVLNEVVVTALGIKKETKALTYNVQELKVADIVTVKDANFVNSLAGKIAGVTINTASSGVGGAARVVMRGTKSISGNNNALYVVDGIPLPQVSSINQPNDLYTGMGQTGDGISALNPDDIESMSVLSGASAAALYGSDAANGVVMITTKKGKTGKLSISISNSTTFSSPFVLPEFQNTYGSDIGSYESWGEKLKRPSSYNPSDFFQTGYNLTNSLSVSTGTEKSQTYFSASAVDASGIIHNNDLRRYNVSFRNSTNLLDDKLSIDLSFMYMNVNEQNMLAQGQYFNPLVPVYLFPRGDKMEKYETFERYNVSRNFKTQFWPYGDQGMQMQNPYWITERDKFNNKKNRYLMSVGAKYNIKKWMNITARAKYDGSYAVNSKRFYASTAGLFAGPTGAYYKSDENVTQSYADVMLNIDKYIGDFSISSTIGASILDVKYNYSSLGSNLHSVANKFTYTNLNLSSATAAQSIYHDQVQAVFGTFQVGYKSKVYLDMSGRNDWSVALAGTEKIPVFYPSVGLSTIWTDLLPINSNILTFLKTRISYSMVGNAPSRYIANPTHAIVNGYPQTTTWLPDKNIRPEKTKSYEFGLNTRLFNNKVNLDITLYKSQTKNQLFHPTLPSSSGWTSYYVNAGRIDNKGLEFTLGFNQKIGPVEWNSNVVYSINRNKIVQLLPEHISPTGAVVSMKEMDMGGTDGYHMILKEGESMGDIYVNTLKTDEHGHIIVNPFSQKVTADPNHFVKAGNSNPLYTIGWKNNFNWKGLELGFLINARVGGVGVSATQAKMDAYGVSKASAVARDNGGVIINGFKVPAKPYYMTIGGGNSGIGSMYTYSATNVRLAELSLSYNVPVKKLCSWIQGLHVSLIGRNLIMLYNKAPFDPEITASTGTYFQGIDYFMQPSLKNVGFSIKLDL